MVSRTFICFICTSSILAVLASKDLLRKLRVNIFFSNRLFLRHTSFDKESAEFFSLYIYRQFFLIILPEYTLKT